MLSPQFSLVRVTAPATAPISLAEAKTQMRVESSDDDSIIQRLIDAAVAFVDVQGALGKAMITQTWGQWLSPNPSTVYLSLGPVQSVSAIKYYDVDGALQTATLADFNVFGTPNRISVSPKSGRAWPVTQTRDDAIKIEYVIGYGSTSSSVLSVFSFISFLLSPSLSLSLSPPLSLSPLLPLSIQYISPPPPPPLLLLSHHPPSPGTVIPFSEAHAHFYPPPPPQDL